MAAVAAASGQAAQFQAVANLIDGPGQNIVSVRLLACACEDGVIQSCSPLSSTAARTTLSRPCLSASALTSNLRTASRSTALRRSLTVNALSLASDLETDLSLQNAPKLSVRIASPCIARLDGRTDIESIANPGWLVADIPAIAAVAHKHGIPLIVDNTLGMGGYLIRPIEHGESRC